MRTMIHVILMVIVLPSLLSAQVKPINKTKVQPQVRTVQTKVTENKQQVIRLNDNADRVISNQVSPVSLLKKSASKNNPDYNVKITQVEKNQFQIPNPYNSENGVVLNATNLSESFTGSYMYITGVHLDADLTTAVKSGSSTGIEFATTSIKSDNVLYANFKNLPGSNHLYLLTLATYLSDDYYEVRIGKSFSNLELTPLDRFVYNPDLHTYQLLLMIDPDSYNQLYVVITSAIKSEHFTVFNNFYYIQLVQLD